MLDLTDQRFGRLVVAKFAGRHGRRRFWSCHCDCGARVEIRGDQLTRGITKSCGCLQRETAAAIGHQNVSQETLALRKVRAQRAKKGLPSNLHVRDLVGQRFGQLTVIKFVKIRKQQSLWRCRCSCGRTTIVTAARLNYGWTKSCGCLQEKNRDRLTHGHTRNRRFTPEYRAWSSMKTRCLNPNSHRWEEYGGRGITICQRWLNSFEAFFTDMGRRPRGHCLDRKNPNGNYNKRNCRWVTKLVSNQNRRKAI